MMPVAVNILLNLWSTRMRDFGRFQILRGLVAFAAFVGTWQALAQGSPGTNFERCRAVGDDAARLRCYEDATSPPQSSTEQPSRRLDLDKGNWRLVRTPDLSSGRDVVSIMHTADIAKSDIDLAGILIRCGEHNIETVVVLVTPLPPRARPKVTLSAGGGSAEFTGSIVPPGAEVLLPGGATDLLSRSLGRAVEVAVQVSDRVSQINGIVSLIGLDVALPELMANCSGH
jgi:hypothetical protein